MAILLPLLCTPDELMGEDYTYQYRLGQKARRFLEGLLLDDEAKRRFAHGNWSAWSALSKPAVGSSRRSIPSTARAGLSTIAFMSTGSIRWLAPRKHRRLLVIVITLVALSFVVLDALSFQLRTIFHSPNLLVRGLAHGALAVWVYAWLFALVLGLPVLLLQPVPWRPESFSYRAYRVLLVLLGAIELALIYTGTAGALRILNPVLIGAALFLPKAIVLWTVPDVPGAWEFKTHAHHP